MPESLLRGKNTICLKDLAGLFDPLSDNRNFWVWHPEEPPI